MIMQAADGKRAQPKFSLAATKPSNNSCGTRHGLKTGLGWGSHRHTLAKHLAARFKSITAAR
jgi:hypothetical protein